MLRCLWLGAAQPEQDVFFFPSNKSLAICRPLLTFVQEIIWSNRTVCTPTRVSEAFPPVLKKNKNKKNASFSLWYLSDSEKKIFSSWFRCSYTVALEKRHIRAANSPFTKKVCGYPDHGVFAPTSLRTEPSSSSRESTSGLWKYLEIILYSATLLPKRLSRKEITLSMLWS